MSAAEEKNKGNDLLKKGETEAAIEAYSKGIECAKAELEQAGTSEELHVLYSNRSMAKLKINDLQGAVEDADSCIKIRPFWGRGYGRKGNALFAMKHFKAALEIYEEGIAVDKGNNTLIDGRNKCRDVLDRMSEAELKQQNEAKDALEAKANAEAEKSKKEEDDDPFAKFMSDVAALEQSSSSQQAERGTTSEEIVLVLDHDADTKDWTSENQTDRILCKNFKWVNANPFEVFGITNEKATAEDIKRRYHRLSSLLHPDKNPHPRAQEAFHELKKAYDKLKVDSTRELLAEIMRQCRDRVIQTRSRLLSKGLTEQEIVERDGTEVDAIRKEVKREFAVREHRREKSELNKRTYNKREMESEQEVNEYWQSVKKAEETMREGRDDRARTWQSFAKRSKR